MDLLFIISLVCAIVKLIKESLEKPVPAENWANKELFYEDYRSGIPFEECMKNVRKGKYKIEKDN